MDLRKRILKAYDRGDVSREQVAKRFEVSLGMVKKLIQRRRHTGSIEPLHHRSGRKPVILGCHRREMRLVLAKQPDLTLEEIRTRLGLGCTVQAIHYVLTDMGLTYKKRRSAPQNNPAPTLQGNAGSGANFKGDSTRHASSSSTNRRPKRT
jgi:transposase